MSDQEITKESLERLEDLLKKPIKPLPPLKAHDLARRLLALPDGELVLVKGEGGGYFTEYAVHPGGPWEAFSAVRLGIQRVENGVAKNT